MCRIDENDASLTRSWIDENMCWTEIEVRFDDYNWLPCSEVSAHTNVSAQTSCLDLLDLYTTYGSGALGTLACHLPENIANGPPLKMGLTLLA